MVVIKQRASITIFGQSAVLSSSSSVGRGIGRSIGRRRRSPPAIGWSVGRSSVGPSSSVVAVDSVVGCRRRRSPPSVSRSAGRSSVRPPFGRSVVVVVVGRSCRAVGRLIGRRRRQPSPSIGRSVRRLVGRVSSSVAAVDRGSVFDLRNHAESASTPSISPTWQPENFALGFRPA